METDEYVSVFNAVKAKVGSDEVAAVILDQVGKDGRVQAMQGFMRPRRPAEGNFRLAGFPGS